MENNKLKFEKINELGMSFRVRNEKNAEFTFQLVAKERCIFSHRTKDFDEGVDALYLRALFEAGQIERSVI